MDIFRLIYWSLYIRSYFLTENLSSEKALDENSIFYAKFKSRLKSSYSRFQQHGSVSSSEQNIRILLNKLLFGDKGVVNLKILRKIPTKWKFDSISVSVCVSAVEY